MAAVLVAVVAELFNAGGWPRGGVCRPQQEDAGNRSWRTLTFL